MRHQVHALSAVTLLGQSRQTLPSSVSAVPLHPYALSRHYLQRASTNILHSEIGDGRRAPLRVAEYPFTGLMFSSLLGASRFIRRSKCNARSSIQPPKGSSRSAPIFPFYPHRFNSPCCFPSLQMSSEYDQKYPPDRSGSEGGDNARVWRVYRERANDTDEDVIGGWHSTLDVLLIFAGLFSAVATSFLLEAQGQLEPDQTQYLVAAFLAVQLNQSIADDRFNPEAYVVPLSAQWITALWLVSLVIALLVALLAILAKQWLGEYSSRLRAPTASHRHWATRHVALHTGLDRWKLDAFIGALPVALHVSLFLFLAGLVLYFWSSSVKVALVTLVMTASVFVFYIGTMIAPLLWSDCPTQIPLLRQAKSLILFISRLFTPGAIGSDGSGSGSTVGREPWRREQALAWMVTTLPAVEDLHAAISAIGCLKDSTSISSKELETSSLCDERVANTVARCTADLLNTPTHSNRTMLDRFIRARMLIQERWDPNSPTAVPPALPENYEPAHHLTADITLIALSLQEPQLYPVAFENWLLSQDTIRPYAASSLQLLLCVHSALSPKVGSFIFKLQLPIRLLAYEMQYLGDTKVESVSLGDIPALLDLLQAEVNRLPSTVSAIISHSSDIRIRSLLIAGRVLGISEQESRTQTDPYVNHERLQTQREALKSAFWLLLSSFSVGAPKKVGVQDFITVVMDTDTVFGTDAPWPRPVLEGLHTLFMATGTEWVTSQFPWHMGRAIRILLAHFWIIRTSEGVQTWMQPLVRQILRQFHPRGQGNCSSFVAQYAQDTSARNICFWLDARDGKPSAWRLVWELSADDFNFSDWHFLHMRLGGLLVVLQRHEYDIAPFLDELVGLRTGSRSIAADYIRRTVDSLAVAYVRHLRKLCSPELWTLITTDLTSLPVTEWQVKPSDIQFSFARALGTFLPILSSDVACSGCATITYLKHESSGRLIQDAVPLAATLASPAFAAAAKQLPSVALPSPVAAPGASPLQQLPDGLEVTDTPGASNNVVNADCLDDDLPDRRLSHDQ
ncbi:hypothetical protein BKA62DRAFT_155021 [Auriculariales sp. MPI-PUGE-AT-0066]|nr:hypothetical protein BKA62DRAFT_155021 [Auriculariales sp. MPI-PUGE-AT-0066]